MCRLSFAAALMCLGAGVGLAYAQEPLRVERGAEAHGCPDAVALGQRVGAVRGRPALVSGDYLVRFAREGGVFTAELRVDGGASVRRLESRATDCEPLARATALTLALLFDAAAERGPAPSPPVAAPARPLSAAATNAPRTATAPNSPRPTPAPASASPAPASGPRPTTAPRQPPSAAELTSTPQAASTEPSPPAATLSPPSAATPERPPPTASAPSPPPRLGLALGTGLASGIVRPWAPILLAELGLRSAALRLGVGADFIPAQRLELGPGAIELSLVAAHARTCFAAFRSASLRAEGCAGVMLGAISADPAGFASAKSRQRLHAALPLELAVGQAAEHFSWELNAALLLVFRRNQFEIDGVGKVYETPALAGLFSLRVAGWIEL